MKKAFLSGCIFILCSACLKAQFNVYSIYRPANAASLNAYKRANALKLLNNYTQLVAKDDSLREKVSDLEQSNDQLLSEIKYRYIREQIELQKFGFFQDGKVLPPYEGMVSVLMDGNGKMTRITVIGTGKKSEANDRINQLFTVNKELEKEYPVTARLIRSGFLQYQDQFNVVMMMQIKQITFPYLISVTSSVSEKKKYNDLLLDFITQANKQDQYRGLLPGYLALEKAKVPSGQLDQVIEFKEKFIMEFKKIYDARHPQ